MNILTEEEIFTAAVAVPLAERAAYLDRACAGSPALRSQVDGLLAAHDQPDSLLASPAFDVTVATAVDADGVGAQIGPYKLLEQIGEGGMGIVYMAQQFHPVKRRVALKLIKPGMDTREVIARFEAERQALAMMEHPNIARIIDAGVVGEGRGVASGQWVVAGKDERTTAEPSSLATNHRPLATSSRPYFVMELVRGLPITDYCDQARLSPDQRLELFVTVCQAVQHAHQKGIIHRDIKPSNILVTLHDGAPVPKVIDFGVAKAINQQLGQQTLFTAFSQVLGTPLYMSPEQVEISGLDIDTRSDVYSLGVLLYELLTGQTPFDRETVKHAGLDELRRMIREDEPARPSQRISTLDAQAITTAAGQRGVDQRRLRQLLQGELDWIVMKALEKDRNRRYESASAFAADVQRYLADEPVQACPPSAAYRLRKFAKRHKAALVMSALITAMLFSTTAVSVRYALDASAARQLADQRLKQSESDYEHALNAIDTIARQVASPQFAHMPEIQEFRQQLLNQAFGFYDAFIAAHRHDPHARHLLARALTESGNINSQLGKYREADDRFSKVVTLYDELIRENPVDEDLPKELAHVWYTRAWVSKNMGTFNSEYLSRAMRLVEELYRKAPARRAGMMAAYYRRQSQFADSAHAAQLMQRAIQLCRDHEIDLNYNMHAWLAQQALAESEFAAAEDHYRHAIQTTSLSEHGLNLCAQYWNALGGLFQKLGRATDAEEAYRAALDASRRRAADSPHMANSGEVLSAHLGPILAFLQGRGRQIEAEHLLDELVREFPKLASLHTHRAKAISEGKPKELAVAAITTAIDDYPMVSPYYEFRSRLLDDLGRFEAATEDWDRAVTLLRSEQTMAERSSSDPSDVKHRLAIALADHARHLRKKANAQHGNQDREVTVRWLAEAEKSFNEAIDIWRHFVAANAGDRNHRIPLAAALREQFQSLHRPAAQDESPVWSAEQEAEADMLLREAILNQRWRVEDAPADARLRDQLSGLLQEQVGYLRNVATHQATEPAARTLREADTLVNELLGIKRQLADESPREPDRRGPLVAALREESRYVRRLAATQEHLPKTLADHEAKANALLDEAIVVQQERLAAAPDNAKLRKYLIEFQQEQATHLAEQLAKQPDKQEAIAALSERIEKYPAIDAYYRYRGTLLSDLGQHQAALKDYSRRIELAPENKDLYVSRGDLSVRSKQYALALPDYTHYLELNPARHVFKRRGVAHFYAGQFENALADLTTAVEAGDTNALVWHSLPQAVGACPDAAFRAGYVALADRLVERNPQSSDALLSRAVILDELGETARAWPDIRSAIAAGNMSYFSHDRVAQLLNGVGTRQEAIDALNTGIEKFPDVAIYRMYRADLRRDLGQSDLALQDYQRAMDLDPKDVRPYGGRGDLYTRTKRYDLAIADYTHHLNVQHGVHIVQRRVVAYFYAGQFEAALTDLREVVTRNPTDRHNLASIPVAEVAACPDADFREGYLALVNQMFELGQQTAGARCRRAVTLAAFGQSDRAHAEFEQARVQHEQALQLDPDNAYVCNDAAWFLATCPVPDMRRPERAVELASKATQLRPDVASYWNTLGTAEYRASQWQAAIDHLNKALPRPSSGTAYDWFFLAMAHWQLGHQQRGREYYDRAITWMQNTARPSEEARQFQLEAMQLIDPQRAINQVPREDVPTPPGSPGGEAD